MQTLSKEVGGEATTQKLETARGYWGFQELTEDELEKTDFE